MGVAAKEKMKAAIFDPYLDTLGGGERYCLTVAEAFLKKGWEVDVFWDDLKIREKLIEKFSLNIGKVNFVPLALQKNNLPNRYLKTNKYDFLFYLSDGSIPFLFAKNNVLHFQVPFTNIFKRSFLTKVKLVKVDSVVCNSFFTKSFIDAGLGIKTKVIYPPVGVEDFKPGKKENIILSVGRFSQLLQNKKQDILIEAFKKMVNENSLKDWKLILAGGSEIGGEEYVEKLKALSKGFPIEIIKNPVFKDLVSLYNQSKIFWSASGYGANEKTEPEKVEHFGISTVEGMAAGLVPVVLGKGGQKEILTNNIHGYFWQTIEELIKATQKVIDDEKLQKRLSLSAIKRSKEFSKEVFYQKIYELL